MIHIINLFKQIQKSILQHKKAGRKPKISDAELCSLYVLSYITNMPVLNLARLLIDPSIQSWHLFRKSRTQRVYKLLREYMINRALLIILLKLILGKKVKLIIDGTILEVAKVSRARTQKR